MEPRIDVLTLRGRVVLPGAEAAVVVTRAADLAALERAVARPEARVLLVNVDGEAAPQIGVEAEIVRLVRQNAAHKETRQEGTRQNAAPLAAMVTLRGLARRRVRALSDGTAAIEPAPELAETGERAGAELTALVAAVRQAARQLAPESRLPERDPAQLADWAAARFGSPSLQAQALAELGVAARLRLVLDGLELRVREQTGRSADLAAQRREILEEKKREILEELGEPDDDAGLELLEKVKQAALPPEVEAVARKQAHRLASMSEASPEHAVTRNYLEWLLELPWTRRTDDRVEVAAARAVLDADHQGLDKVKRRILEYLAVRKLAVSKKGPILCLAGPPGVGKTSLGASIARALGRELVRVSLGGVRDEAEIRGHRRTYVGALPGRILQALRRAGTKNPVFVLDEIDKLSADFRGDPAAALLEVLDPEQNGSFSDHYIEVPFDLSEVIFIATANDLSSIPAPLLDRMEVLALPGYPLAEKRAIAQRYLVPRQLREHGLDPGLVTFTDEALDEIISGYTREAGVRTLEREIATVLRALAVRVASHEPFLTEVCADALADFLGPPRFASEVAEETSEPGVATGLAWTPTGGEILFIEATRMPGHGNLVITGQLGDVMRESALAALSYVRSNAARWGLLPELFARSDVHLHVPAGATPKDGPSAGNALVTALVSLFTGRRVRGDVAMTGEITLRGAVLPVGGIASKVLAAHRAGVRRVILPERNAKDLVEVPAEVRAALEVVLVRRIEETLAAALTDEPMVLPAEAAPVLELRAA